MLCSRARVGEEVLCSSFFFRMAYLALQQRRGLRCGLSNVLCSSVVVLCSLRGNTHLAIAGTHNAYSASSGHSHVGILVIAFDGDHALDTFGNDWAEHVCAPRHERPPWESVAGPVRLT